MHVCVFTFVQDVLVRTCVCVLRMLGTWYWFHKGFHSGSCEALSIYIPFAFVCGSPCMCCCCVLQQTDQIRCYGVPCSHTYIIADLQWLFATSLLWPIPDMSGVVVWFLAWPLRALQMHAGRRRPSTRSPNTLSMSRLSQMALGHPLHSPPVSCFHRALWSLTSLSCHPSLQTEWPWSSEPRHVRPTRH